jgi:hypothetical protein
VQGVSREDLRVASDLPLRHPASRRVRPSHSIARVVRWPTRSLCVHGSRRCIRAPGAVGGLEVRGMTHIGLEGWAHDDWIVGHGVCAASAVDFERYEPVFRVAKGVVSCGPSR